MGSEDTRSKLVTAGVELIEETGTVDIGLRAIARRAGVSHGAPRRWFPTHRSLLAAIAEVGLRQLAAELATAADQSGNDLVAIAIAYVDFARRWPAMFALIFRHDLLEGSGTELRKVSQPLFWWLSQVVAQSTDVNDPATVAAAIWSSIHGVAALSSTDALGLAAQGVNEDDLLRRVVRAHLS
ncbi:MAG: TetR/AcrR family transcriptional regulator [Tomitella sp.]|nr:TetR/AcrR family transcriptional regulator [Tomitella sp.]